MSQTEDEATMSATQTQTLPPAFSAMLPSRVQAVFVPRASNRLLFASAPQRSHRTRQGAVGRSAGTEQTYATHMAEFGWDVLPGRSHQLLYSWHSLFRELQPSPGLTSSSLPDRSSLPWREHVLSVCRRSRAELEATITEATRGLNKMEERKRIKMELKEKNLSLSDYTYHLLLLETCKSLLHLVEIVYLDPHLSLTAQFVDWVQRTIQKPKVEEDEQEGEEEEDDDAMDEDEGQDEMEGRRKKSSRTSSDGRSTSSPSPVPMRDTDSHWMCLCRHLLQGRLFEALQMLQSCGELSGPDSPYASVTRLLIEAIETTPALAYRQSQQQQQQGGGVKERTNSASTDDVPLDHFLTLFSSWRRQLSSILDHPILVRHPHPQIEMAIAVLLGENSAMCEVAGSNYLELFIGHLLYVDPALQNSRREYALLLQKCMHMAEKEWQREKEEEERQRKEEGGNEDMDATEDGEEDESLYTPIDTLRYALVSHDIPSALTLMYSMLELRFFLAHMVALLDAIGALDMDDEDEEEEGREDEEDDTRMSRKPATRSSHRVSSSSSSSTPLRLHASSIGSEISVKEFYFILYGESLEAASIPSLGGEQSIDEELWQIAVDYYAACPEYGRAYLTHLVESQPLTRRIPAIDGRAASAAASSTVIIIQERKVHQLLDICSKFHLHASAQMILNQIVNTCVRLGMDGIRSCQYQAQSTTTAAGSAKVFKYVHHHYASNFGQAAFWAGVMQPPPPPSGSTSPDADSIARATINKLESIVETLLDVLLLCPQRHMPVTAASGGVLRPANVGRFSQESVVATSNLAFRALSNVLAHVPSALLATLPPPPASDSFILHAPQSGLLSFAATFYSMMLFALKAGHVAQEITRETQKQQQQLMAEMTSSVDGSTATATSATLTNLLSLHSYVHSNASSLLLALLHATPLILSSRRKYWMGILRLVVDFAGRGEAIHVHASTSKRGASVNGSKSGNGNGEENELGCMSLLRHFESSGDVEEGCTWFDASQPSSFIPDPSQLPPPPSIPSSFPMPSLHLARQLLSSLTHSMAHKQYAEAAGGSATVNNVQKQLHALTLQSCTGCRI